ncbi:MAG: tRNA (5-methylaminomethyl-2-thiouridine)(34)-methyltransferase MnmD [Pseudomonadota bacterium]
MQKPHLGWRGETPVSLTHDEPFFTVDDGLAEARHVFLAGDRLPERFCPGFRIAELGFGTGLNLLAAWMAWRSRGVSGPLHYTSFEIAPMDAADRRRALAPWPELMGLAEELAALLVGGPAPADLKFELIVGDARQTVPAWQGTADAWFLDGFSPAKNPEMWAPELLTAVAARTRPMGSFATFTAASAVRRALTTAGFQVEKTSGFGRKREMLCGVLAQ